LPSDENYKGVSEMVKKQMNIIILVGIVVLITASSGCYYGSLDPWEEGDIDASGGVKYETYPESSSNSDICPECNGAGVVECYNYRQDIESCEGTGRVTGGPTEGTKCRICDGTGQITCPKCGGTGKI
jgi:RecJ-like exonuclease